jgi:hypothetical protein
VSPTFLLKYFANFSVTITESSFKLVSFFVPISIIVKAFLNSSLSSGIIRDNLLFSTSTWSILAYTLKSSWEIAN